MMEQPDRNYLLEPEIAFDGKRAAEFKQIYVEAVVRGPDSLIDYRLDCPKYEFLAYLGVWASHAAKGRSSLTATYARK